MEMVEVQDDWKHKANDYVSMHTSFVSVFDICVVIWQTKYKRYKGMIYNSKN
jgi:hypothetical protein